MNSKKRKLFSLFVLAALISPLTIAAVTGFYGFGGPGPGGECDNCHNEPASAYGGAYATETLILDGSDRETFWQSHLYRGMEIPIGNTSGTTEQFVRMIFAQNSTHLFIWADWSDPIINGTDTEMYDNSESFSICFNINVPDFQARYAAMSTPPGTTVDTIIWKPAASTTDTQVTGTGYVNQTVTGSINDYVMTSTGWDNDTTENYQVAARHGNLSGHHEENYGLEIIRPLVTNDPQDVQFDHAGNYEFAIAVFNGTSGIEHYMSFVHAVYVYVPSTGGDGGIPGFSIILAIFPVVLMVAIIFMYKRRAVPIV